MGNRSASLLLGLLLCVGVGSPARAQGCSQCRDNVSQTNPAVQQSYREAILLMIGAVGVVTSAMVLVMRRMR